MWFKVIHLPSLKVEGMALFPFILVKKAAGKTDTVLINHEKIHLAQQLELLILPFYFLYLGQYILNLVRFRNHHQAYRNIVFEKEAYAMEAQRDYLKRRSFWAWRKFL
jgi:DNA phosphorothioation-dependent restriction protein DptG